MGSEEIRREGVEMSFYPDGSGPGLHLTREGTKYSGCNERLATRDRPEWRAEGNLTTNPLATTLLYSRDVGYCHMPYAVINGDLGRAFPPQPWLTVTDSRQGSTGTERKLGIMPILHVTRLFAYADGQSKNVFRFDATAASTDERTIRAIVWLIASGWSNGFIRAPTLPECGQIMENMGMDLKSPIRKIIRPWLCAHLYGGPKFLMQRNAHTVEAARIEGGPAETARWLDRLSADIEKYAILPRSELRFKASRHEQLKYQGLDSRGRNISGPRTITGSSLINMFLR